LPTVEQEGHIIVTIDTTETGIPHVSPQTCVLPSPPPIHAWHFSFFSEKKLFLFLFAYNSWTGDIL
jgi:hypothetical protein